MIDKFIIFLGAPASGKGTQAEMLAEKYGYPYIVASKLIEKELEKNENQEIKHNKEKGKLLPDDFINDLLYNELKSQKGVVVLDGYPRTLGQAQFLDENFPQSKKVVLDLDISDEVAIHRITGRRICQDCGKILLPPDSLALEKCPECSGEIIQRTDDMPDVAKNRLSIYHKQTAPLIDFYVKNNSLIRIKGEGSINEVADLINNKIHG